jgi:histidinol-phosphate aminotransferase
MDVESLINPHLRAMQPYTPIVPFEVLSRRLGRAPEDIVKLDANENPYGPSPRALEAIASAGTLHIYPDPEQTLLREAISSYINVPMEHILCGAGGDEIIDLIGRAFIQAGDAIIDLPPTFGMYRWEADVVNAQYVKVPRRDDFSIDVEAVERLVNSNWVMGHLDRAQSQLPITHYKLLFVTNPNNPDGSVVSEDDLNRLLALPVVVVLDEAYIDFSTQPSRAGWVAQHDNLIVLRTFSKLAGMAGLRVGYGIFPLPVIKHLWKIKQPYTPNVAGTVGAIAALGDPDYLRDNVQRIVAERERMGELLSELGWLQPLPSETNFILCRVNQNLTGGAQRTDLSGVSPDLPVGKQVKLALEQHGVLVRWFDKDGLRNCIRISVGRPDQTDRLMAALKSIAG